MNYSLSKYAKMKFITTNDASHWFGYYNYCPIDETENMLLCHKVDFDGRNVEKDDTAQIGYFTLDDGNWHPIAQTHAVNWQQGSMSQWIHIDGEQRIIANDTDGDHFVSRIYNTDGTLYKTLPHPVYGIDDKQGFSITINFERAYFCRTYHYESIINDQCDVNVLEGDGIFRLDLKTGEYKKIISIEDIINTDPQPGFENGKHWVEHIMLNPSGTRFAFYHRFDLGNGYQTRAFTANTDGSDMYMLSGWEDNQWSHLGWRDDSSFVLFGVKRKKLGNVYQNITKSHGRLGSFIRKCYRTFVAPLVSAQLHNKLAAGSNYQLYSDKKGIIGNFEKKDLVHDGHPSFTKDGRFMLTDTYADEKSMRHLLIYDTKENKTYDLGRFYSPFNAVGYRCDLHPRFSTDESMVCFDTAHTGRHQQMVIEINWKKILKQRD